MPEKGTKEKPILFNGDMVRAILDGRKTQTRRPVKEHCLDFIGAGGRQGPEWDDPNYWGWEDPESPGTFAVLSRTPERGHWSIPSKYNVGDRLWVREKFQPYIIAYTECHEPDWAVVDYQTGAGHAVNYPATDGVMEYANMDTGGLTNACKPSIHMPRWAARLFLEVTEVRVERLNDISEEGAIAEGFTEHSDPGMWQGYVRGPDGSLHHGMSGTLESDPPEWMIEPRPARCPELDMTAAEEFRRAWDSIYEDYPWSDNPWAWAYTFKRLEAPDA